MSPAVVSHDTAFSYQAIFSLNVFPFLYVQRYEICEGIVTGGDAAGYLSGISLFFHSHFLHF